MGARISKQQQELIDAVLDLAFTRNSHRMEEAYGEVRKAPFEVWEQGRQRQVYTIMIDPKQIRLALERWRQQQQKLHDHEEA